MLELSDVSHVYSNGVRALDHVTLSIPRGMFGLLGPNGAGKSTLMRTLATLQTPTEGGVRFGDIDVLAEPEDCGGTRLSASGFRRLSARLGARPARSSGAAEGHCRQGRTRRRSKRCSRR